MQELHDSIEDQIRAVMLGDGLIDGPFDPTILRIDQGRSAELDALAAYAATFEIWPNPNRNADGTLSESARRGMQIYMSGSPDCRCHGPDAYADQQQHNLANFGFSLEEFDTFDTPTLYGLWATAPYMHDGVVLTLEALLSNSDPVHSVADRLTPQQLADLIAFLLSL
jgi:cytochrome c peroxidase